MRQVYIVEPDNDLRTLLTELLTDAGFGVRIMPSTSEALLALETSETPSIVLVDSGVPSVADVESLTRITALQRHIILLLSTNPDRLPALEASQRRPIIIAEPFDIEDLLYAVERAAMCVERI